MGHLGPQIRDPGALPDELGQDACSLGLFGQVVGLGHLRRTTAVVSPWKTGSGLEPNRRKVGPPDESWALAPNYRQTKGMCQAADARVRAPETKKAKLKVQKLKSFFAMGLRVTVARPARHICRPVKKTDIRTESPSLHIPPLLEAGWHSDS